MKDVKFEYNYLGIDEKGFNFTVSINGQSFPYFMGIGHKPKSPSKRTFPVPEINGVVYCLLGDMDCASESFEDFCDNLGYDTDSRSALETYLACQEYGNKLRKALSSEQIEEFRVILEDY